MKKTIWTPVFCLLASSWEAFGASNPPLTFGERIRQRAREANLGDQESQGRNQPTQAQRTEDVDKGGKKNREEKEEVVTDIQNEPSQDKLKLTKERKDSLFFQEDLEKKEVQISQQEGSSPLNFPKFKEEETSEVKEQETRSKIKPIRVDEGGYSSDSDASSLEDKESLSSPEKKKSLTERICGVPGEYSLEISAKKVTGHAFKNLKKEFDNAKDVQGLQKEIKGLKSQIKGVKSMEEKENLAQKLQEKEATLSALRHSFIAMKSIKEFGKKGDDTYQDDALFFLLESFRQRAVSQGDALAMGVATLRLEKDASDQKFLGQAPSHNELFKEGVAEIPEKKSLTCLYHSEATSPVPNIEVICQNTGSLRDFLQGCLQKDKDNLLSKLEFVRESASKEGNTNANYARVLYLVERIAEAIISHEGGRAGLLQKFLEEKGEKNWQTLIEGRKVIPSFQWYHDERSPLILPLLDELNRQCPNTSYFKMRKDLRERIQDRYNFLKERVSSREEEVFKIR